MSARRIYHTSVSLEEAWDIWSGLIGTLKPLEGETVPVTDSRGRVTAGAVHARISSPFYHAAAMDGYAVRFQETFTASEAEPLRLRLREQALPVNTGDPLPEGYNAVVMVEEVNLTDGGIEIISPTSPYENVRVVGEDIVQTELILPENHLIRPVDMGAMIAGGNHEISVRRRPFVTIIPTGNEVVPPGTPLRTGNIIDSNSFMVGAMINQWGGEYNRTDVVPDNKELLKQRISLSADISDVVIVLAGASAGTKDFTPNAVDELGTVLVHGIRIKPGRPVLLGTVRGKPVMGLPGYPVAAALTFEIFGRPLLCRLLGREAEQGDTLRARLSRPVASSLGHEEFLRVKLGRVGERLVATPVGRGAGALMTLQRADGIVRIPAMSEGIAPDTEVDVRLLRSRAEIDNTVVCIGSHDNTLDVLANILRRRVPAYSLSSAHVGSMGGLMAVKKLEAHIAGTHLLDEKSGEYNVPFIQRFLKDVPLKLINLVYRQQGLIVRKGNPLNIRGIHDLTREDVVFINRQAGSGTRLLTDKCLREGCIDQQSVRGYDKEEFTHMGVASAVASGAADAGMGILTAAIALNLEFIPVVRERYDLVVRKEHAAMPMVKAFLDIIADDREFRKAVLALGGYDVRDMGKVMYEQ
ncbi:MAG: molybdopterin biosynthesis protein [Nitrospiraceae bacterium]|nr:MAG: molybdopterin biosynthesis protein [Nitrospiraceae bacterium]